MILDGWGIGKKDKADAIFQAKTPNMDMLTEKYPHAYLNASGEYVGLPDGQMGNSEVGHLNIGAGRIVYQDLVRINLAIKDGSMAKNPVIAEAYTYAAENKKKVHLLGLVSDGGVHSLDAHIYHLCDIAKQYGLKNVYIHAFTDGRDTDPKSGYSFLERLQDHLNSSVGHIASVVGRYYAMDRDNRWERVKKAYDLLVHGQGEKTQNILESVQNSYANNVTDEFIKPIVCTNSKGEPLAKIEEGDVVICFNFRTDRLRELTIALTQRDMIENGMTTIPLHYLTMTRYDDKFQNVNIIYDKDNLSDTLGEVLSKAGKSQIRIAETEKYAHVTFFFSGGREKEFPGEKRIMVPSPKVGTYDLKPEMSAYLVKDAIVAELKKAETDFVCLNFANGDMVGHTGVYNAIIKALEAVDKCVGEVVEAAKNNGYEVIIIADHGNADFTINEDGSPNTAHSTNPVPCIVVSDRFQKVNPGILADIAPTILHMIGLPQAEIMTGKVLVS